MSQKQTPMMEQYWSIKNQYEDALLFFRLGDFYELFNDDALTASRELNITLTGRGTGQEGKTPMCGVPYHAADSYIETLIKKGYKVAVCEQLEDPKQVKGIVKRDVVKVITPGTVMTENGTDARSNNFLALWYPTQDGCVLLFCDVSTGEIVWAVLGQKYSDVYDALAMYRPTEIVLANNSTLPPQVMEYVNAQLWTTMLSPYHAPEDTNALRLIAGEAFSHIGLVEEDVWCALGYLLSYLHGVIKTETSHISYVHPLNVGNRMILDTSSLRHLEITHNLRDGGVKGTLLSVLDTTLTPMGARLLKQWLEAPLTDVSSIQRRQMAVSEWVNKIGERTEVRTYLDRIFDFERIIGRVETGSVSPRDFLALRESLQQLPAIKGLLSSCTSLLLQQINNAIQTHDDVLDLLQRALLDQPALTLKEGKVIRDGYNEELDELRSLATNSQEWLARMETQVKEETGLSKLKTGYNKVFGYYFEVTKSNVDQVPPYFIRKQTLTNAERYITPELKEFEIKILSAKEKIVALEQKLYQDLRQQVKAVITEVQETARSLAELDVIISLSTVAYEKGYICPTVVKNGHINIRDGRHPVIESFLKREVFVPNDVTLNHDEEEFLLITGPNMAGKSTYMRQVAILMIMAQMGSFIPAREAIISPVDRVFTRVGASDDISTGQSTFMVEMKEVAYILENATPHSLIILDEIGRGTSTFDGLSIAQAVVEYICKHIHAKTLFATHYHELIPLEQVYSKLKNYTVAVKEKGKDVAFLRRIVRGGADRSYGIHVAKLAGLPNTVLKRAETILSTLESQEANPSASLPVVAEAVKQQKPEDVCDNLFTHSVVDDLLAYDVMSMTPIEALNALYALQEEARKGGGK